MWVICRGKLHLIFNPHIKLRQLNINAPQEKTNRTLNGKFMIEKRKKQGHSATQFEGRAPENTINYSDMLFIPGKADSKFLLSL